MDNEKGQDEMMAQDWRTDCSDWDVYVSTPFNREPTSTFRSWFDRFLPVNPDWTILEIGACPGNHLAAVCHSHKYKPVALDYHPSVHQLKSSFDEIGIPDLKTIHTDFFTWEPDERFDVVMSLGFIEHFEDGAGCLSRHWKLVKEGGYLFIGLPIIGPMQHLLRYLVLPPDQYERAMRIHNLRIMNMNFLRRTMNELGVSDLLCCHYVRKMQNWFEGTDDLRERNRWVFPLWNMAARIPEALGWSCHFFSPYGILVAQKMPPGSLPGNRT